MSEQPISTLKENRFRGGHNFSCALYQSALEEITYIVKYHWHDELEILYFAGGDYLLEINMEQYHITSECIYFVNPGELHQLSTLSPANQTATSIVFDLGILHTDNMDSAELEIMSPLLRGAFSFPRCIDVSHPAFQDVYYFFEHFASLDGISLHPETPTPLEHFITSAPSQLMAKAYFFQLISILYRLNYFSEIEPVYNKKVETIKAALSYIKDHYQDKLYIRDLASQVGMNEQYFCRFFKKALGRSPMEYINEFRIRKAIELLEKTNRSVTEICMEAGFNNLGNFLREFKKETGTTPLKYRKGSENV